MTAEAQVLFFMRIKAQFDRATTGIPVNQKKKYRMSTEELMRVRNTCVLFQQCFHFLFTQAGSEAEEWRTAFIQGSDEDWKVLLEARPSKMALSMLQSVQDRARQQLIQKEATAMQDVEDQRQEVMKAEWLLFQTSLEKDQQTLAQAAEAPKRVKSLQHAREVEHRNQQAADGMKAAKGYQAGSGYLNRGSSHHENHFSTLALSVNSELETCSPNQYQAPSHCHLLLLCALFLISYSGSQKVGTS